QLSSENAFDFIGFFVCHFLSTLLFKLALLSMCRAGWGWRMERWSTRCLYCLFFKNTCPVPQVSTCRVPVPQVSTCRVPLVDQTAGSLSTTTTRKGGRGFQTHVRDRFKSSSV